MRSGRQALLITSAAYVVALAWSALVLPERVPSHFDGSGRVDDWTARTSMLAFWAVVGVVVLLGMPALTRLVSAGDGSWVNMPQRSKDYWFAAERRVEFRTRFQDDVEGFTAITALLLVGAVTMSTWVGTTGRDSVPGWVFVVSLGLYLLATVVWTVRLLRKYRAPHVE